MNHPKSIKARQSQIEDTVVANTPQGRASKSKLTRKADRSANESEGLLANTARAIGSMMGKFVATAAKKTAGKAAAGQGSTKKAPQRSGRRRAVGRDSKGRFRKGDSVGRSLGAGIKQTTRIKVRAGQRDRSHQQRTKTTGSKREPASVYSKGRSREAPCPYP